MSNYDGERVLVDKGRHNTAYSYISHIWKNEKTKWFFLLNIFFLQVKVCDPPKSYLPPAPRCGPLLSSPLSSWRKSNYRSAFYFFPHYYLKVDTFPLSWGDVVVIMVNEDVEAEEDMRTHWATSSEGWVFHQLLWSDHHWIFSGGRPAATCCQACWRCHPGSAQVGWP